MARRKVLILRISRFSASLLCQLGNYIFHSSGDQVIICATHQMMASGVDGEVNRNLKNKYFQGVVNLIFFLLTRQFLIEVKMHRFKSFTLFHITR